MLRLKFNLILKLGTQSSAIIVSGCNCNRLEVDFNLKLEDNCHSGQHLQATLRQRNQLHCLHKDDFVIKDDFDITKDTVLAVTRYPQKTEMWIIFLIGDCLELVAYINCLVRTGQNYQTTVEVEFQNFLSHSSSKSWLTRQKCAAKTITFKQN